MHFPGLRRQFECLLDCLASAQQADVDALLTLIRQTSQGIEHALAHNRVHSAQLSAETRSIRGWVGFFAERFNIETYVAAINCSRQVFETTLKGSRRWRPPISIHFRPLRGIYRFEGFASSTRVALPTPMIAFDEALFEKVAGLALRQRKNKQLILEAMLHDDYQTIQTELECRGGIVEQTRGAHHDLAAVFTRVNTRFFGGVMARPRLIWNRGSTRRKFGHYDPLRDTVMLSQALDDARVPAFVVEFVLYHELLHKKHGITWQNGKARVHTPAFKREEKLFPRYAAAEAILKQIARSS